jgi:hypothetical protein
MTNDETMRISRFVRSKPSQHRRLKPPKFEVRNPKQIRIGFQTDSLFTQRRRGVAVFIEGRDDAEDNGEDKVSPA